MYGLCVYILTNDLVVKKDVQATDDALDTRVTCESEGQIFTLCAHLFAVSFFNLATAVAAIPATTANIVLIVAVAITLVLR